MAVVMILSFAYLLFGLVVTAGTAIFIADFCPRTAHKKALAIIAGVVWPATMVVGVIAGIVVMLNEAFEEIA